MLARSFRDLIIWQRAIELSLATYSLTNPSHEKNSSA